MLSARLERLITSDMFDKCVRLYPAIYFINSTQKRVREDEHKSDTESKREAMSLNTRDRVSKI